MSENAARRFYQGEGEMLDDSVDPSLITYYVVKPFKVLDEIDDQPKIDQEITPGETKTPDENLEFPNNNKIPDDAITDNDIS